MFYTVLVKYLCVQTNTLTHSQRFTIKQQRDAGSSRQSKCSREFGSHRVHERASRDPTRCYIIIVCMYVYMYVCMYVCIYSAPARSHATLCHKCLSLSLCVCVCVCVYIYIYIHTHLHVCIARGRRCLMTVCVCV